MALSLYLIIGEYNLPSSALRNNMHMHYLSDTDTHII